MAYFARKLRYGAHGGDGGVNYMALLEIAKKKGGRPVEFVLYRRIIQYPYPGNTRRLDNRIEMVRLKAATAEEAIKRFWPWDEGTGKKFPGHHSSRWKKTTLWLDSVAVGGWYERFGYSDDQGKIQFGTWVRVGTPVPWHSRRRKKRIQFGNPAHIVLARQATIRALKDEKMRLEWSLNDLEGYDNDNDCNYIPEENELAYAAVRKQINKLEAEISSAEGSIANLTAEMRYKVRRMFPNPVGKTPKRALRQQEAV